MRIAFLSDTHLGYRKYDQTTPDGTNLRTADFGDSFEAAISDILLVHQRNPFDLFIHGGDIFDRPRPPYAEIARVIRAVTDLSQAGLPQCWIAGNHDMPGVRSGETAVGLLARMPFPGRVCFAVERLPKVQVIQGTYVHLVPWDAWSMYDPGPDLGGSLIVVCHGDIQDGSIVDNRSLYRLPDTARLVLAGHLHEHPDRGPNVLYGSCTERSGFRDLAAVPSWSEVVVAPGGTSSSRQSVPSRSMVDLGEISEGPGMTTRVLESLVRERIYAHDLGPGAIARITLRTSRNVVGELRAAFADLNLLHLQVDTVRPGTSWRAGTIEPVRESLDIPTLFEEFLRTLTDAGDGYIERLRTRGLDALTTAREQEQAAE